MKEESATDQKGYRVQGAAAVIKGLRLLMAIPELGRDATVRALQEAVDMPRPTVYRLLNTLMQEGFVERNPVSGEYVLGRQVVRLAQQSQAGSSLPAQVRGTLERISVATGETVHLAVPYGCHMTFIDKVESAEAVRMASYVGMPVPMHSTSVGKAYLAVLDEPTREQYLEQLTLEPVTPHTITSLEALREELARTRARGYAIDDEENERGIICFGRAIWTTDGALAGAISVSVPRYRLPERDPERIVEAITHGYREAGLD